MTRKFEKIPGYIDIVLESCAQSFLHAERVHLAAVRWLPAQGGLHR
jgi:hypothetical protein